MRIADDTIEEVRRASDVVDVLSQYLQLKKRGKNYLGLCPFHQEKTPSFNVSPEKQMYHCFGCGVGGNVFTFVMEHDKVSFVEAVRTLAQRAGITLPADGAGGRGESTEHEGLYDACRTAGLYFHETLVNSVEGKLALEYFRHRGFSDATITKFGLGYSRNSWDGLGTLAAERKLDGAHFEKAGLGLRREDGTCYDRFRGRAMFPIFSPSGRPVGFGARKMREDDPLGKYINSPETPIYVKSRSLYGLCQSKEAIRANECAILVEGYADLISVYQAGVSIGDTVLVHGTGPIGIMAATQAKLCGAMKVLITGITGFVGSHLAEYLLSRGDCEVHGTMRRVALEDPTERHRRIREPVQATGSDLRGAPDRAVDTPGHADGLERSGRTAPSERSPRRRPGAAGDDQGRGRNARD